MKPDDAPLDPPEGSKNAAPHSATAPRGQLARKILPGGEEPDPRFSLANERTFLAWIQTSLALLAGGIGVEAFVADIFVPPVRQTIAVSLLTLSVFIAVSSTLRWIHVERAMRHKDPLPLPLAAPILAVVVVLAAADVIIFVVMR